jgi:hypothetical protein
MVVAVRTKEFGLKGLGILRVEESTLDPKSLTGEPCLDHLTNGRIRASFVE